MTISDQVNNTTFYAELSAVYNDSKMFRLHTIWCWAAQRSEARHLLS